MEHNCEGDGATFLMALFLLFYYYFFLAELCGGFVVVGGCNQRVRELILLFGWKMK